MTIRQQMSHETIQKVCHLHNGIFQLIQLRHTILLDHFPCAIPQTSLRNYRMREKIFCIYGCFSVLIYIKRGRKPDL